MDLMNMPVTLVVKAPNQRVQDQTVECMLGWTVKKLKAHLSEVYPSQPKENQQKLIYSGQLLHDHLMLKDVLRQYDNSPTQHTVHLVCLHGSDGSSQPKKNTSMPTTVESSQSSQGNLGNTQQSAPSNDGLRHRQTAQQQQQAFQEFYQANAGAMMGMPPGGMVGYSPQQIMWMQHMYSQQMALYMQQYQQGWMQQQQSSTASTNQTPPINVNAPLNNQPNNQPPRPANQQPEQVRMNAQGGAVIDDDEDEVGNRDWLDWIYTFCRVGVLFSIVYFYSSLGRFFMVFGFFVMIYLYQTGAFRLRRRQVNQNPRENPAPQPANQNQPQAAEAETDDTPDSNSTQAEPQEPPPPGALAVAWSFFTTFFSSLIPQQPGAVNAN